MASEPGPEYWARVAGIDSYDTFRDRVGPYLPDIHWFGIGPSTEDVVLMAWHDPFSVPGSAANITLGIQGLTGNTPEQTHNLARAVAPWHESASEKTMGQLIIPGCFQVAIEGQSGGQPIVNVVGVRNAGGTAAGAVAAVRTAWKVATGPLANLSGFYTLVQFRGMDLGSADGAIALQVDSQTGGVPTANSLATNAACALVKMGGGTRSKSSRGRLYYGPLMETNLNPDGRTLVASNQASMQTAFDAFRNSLGSSGYPLVVLSRTKSIATTVTSCQVESVIATQRRRIRA